METISILWWSEDLACDWSENNEHSRHILGVHRFRSFTVMDATKVYPKYPAQHAADARKLENSAAFFEHLKDREFDCIWWRS